MTRWLVCVLVMAGFLLFPQGGRADAPTEIAGIRLGANVSEIGHLLRIDDAIPVRHEEYLREAPIKDLEGFRSGYVTYGDCAHPGRIVRIKLKYEREDRQFFDEILKRYQKNFGETCEYKGDPFRLYIAWKWAFTDKDGNRISLILQHNSSGEEEYTSGNSVKMTSGNRLEEEEACYLKKHPKASEPPRAPSKARTPIDFEGLIPR